jgi:hypothetical protein
MGWIKDGLDAVTEIKKYAGSRQAKKVEELSQRVWRCIKNQRGTTLSIPSASLASHLGLPLNEVKAALRLLRHRRLITLTYDEGTCFSDAATRAFN